MKLNFQCIYNYLGQLRLICVFAISCHMEVAFLGDYTLSEWITRNLRDAIFKLVLLECDHAFQYKGASILEHRWCIFQYKIRKVSALSITQLEVRQSLQLTVIFTSCAANPPLQISYFIDLQSQRFSVSLLSSIFANW